MFTRYRLAIAAVVLACAHLTSAAANAAMEPIEEIKNATPNDSVFQDAARGKPLEIRSAEDAAKYFSDKNLAALKASVDFEKQVVLVFAWRGSGQDKLTYDVAESFPEQISFAIKPGRTRDLRPHVHVFALRSNVKWSVKK